MSGMEQNNECGPVVADVGITDGLGLYYLAQFSRRAGVTVYPFDTSTSERRRAAAELFTAVHCNADEDPAHYMAIANTAMERGGFVVGLAGYSSDPRICGHYAISGVQQAVQQLVSRLN